MFAERLVARGHDVHVLTSCARRFTDWADEYPAGTTIAAGVNVHRLPVRSPRDLKLFAALDHWAANGPRPIPLAYQELWMRAVGPELDGHREWLRSNAAEFDAVIHMTYLFATTTTGLPVVAGRVPVVVQPTAHDEPSIRVQRFDTIVRLADSFIFLTPEEEALVRRRFFLDPVGVVSGIGFDAQVPADPGAIRSRLGLGEDPYLVYLGRIDPAKGAVEAWRFFDAYKRRRGGSLKFVVAGEAVVELPSHPDVVHAGILSEEDKRSLLAGSTALVQPSQLESFSIVLCETWLQGRPALVHANSPVLVGQARRSHGAIPYAGFARFEAAVDLLMSDSNVGNTLGAAGRRYVETAYSWPTVLDRIEEAIGLARARFEERRRSPGTAAAMHARG
jgi:glycosyltransferase involved in cell wall biosynthesis